MSLISNKTQNSATENYNQANLFCEDNVKKSTNIRNYWERRRLYRQHSARLLRYKASCVHAVFNFFMDNANNETGISWHCVKTIAFDIGYSERSVIRATNELHKLGLVLKKQRGRDKYGKNLTNLYCINYEDSPIKQCSNPPTCDEVTTCVRQSSIREDKSNYNEVNVNKIIPFKNKKLKPWEEIDIDKFFPSGKAYELLRKYTTPASWDVYMSDFRCYARDKEKEFGRLLRRFEANYIACFSFTQTHKLWKKYEGRYIRLEVRRKHRQSKNVIEISKRLSEEALKSFSKEEIEYYNSLN